MKSPSPAKTSKTSLSDQLPTSSMEDTMKIPIKLFADLEATIDEVTEVSSKPTREARDPDSRDADLRTLIQVSLAINSSLVLDDVLQLVMRKAIELMKAERGFIMLLDKNNELQVKAACNIFDGEITTEQSRICSTIAAGVAENRKSVYTTDAQSDDRFAHQQSVIDLHLRSIMCVPLQVKQQVIGVIYLDNSSHSGKFLRSDLYVFELYAQMVSQALHNAHIYDALVDMEKYSDSVIANSPVGIIVLDAKGRILTFNPKGLEIFDLDKARVTTLQDKKSLIHFVSLLPPAGQSRWQTMIELALTTGQQVSENRYSHDTGYLEKVLSLRISPLSNVPGGGDGLIMTIEDITDKVTMEQYVILSEKLVARGEMAASVAHELNNYLAIISNNAELLSINVNRNKYDRVADNCQSITRNIQKIKRFVENLMDFSKPEPDYMLYSIKELIDDLLFSLRIQPRFKLIHFTLELEKDIPNVELDVGQIQQVLHNLLNNAADAIEEKASHHNGDYEREITLKATYDRKSEQTYIAIVDNGIGMSEETLGKIFSLHFSTKKTGHGIGLYNCQVIATEHGGQLDVTSTYGYGTTFTLTLPQCQLNRRTKTGSSYPAV